MGTAAARAVTGWRDPGKNAAQSAFLHSFRPRNIFCAGRGSGKTIVLCQRARIFARMWPGVTCYLTEQTGPDVYDILIPAWRYTVPSHEYRIVTRHGRIDALMRNGSVVRFRARHAKTLRDDPPFRGPQAGYIGHDEAALDIRDDHVPTLRDSAYVCLEIGKLTEAAKRIEKARVLDPADSQLKELSRKVALTRIKQQAKNLLHRGGFGNSRS